MVKDNYYEIACNWFKKWNSLVFSFFKSLCILLATKHSLNN
jgi:hypothetical protein